jgi:hypothetical protein
MRAEERAQQAEASISMRELLCSPTLRAPLLIGVVMQLSQQLSGINAVTVVYTIDPSPIEVDLPKLFLPFCKIFGSLYGD